MKSLHGLQAASCATRNQGSWRRNLSLLKCRTCQQLTPHADVFDRGHHWRDRNDTAADAAAALHARWLHLTDTGIDVRLRDGDRSTLTEYHHVDRHSYLISLRRALGLREALATLELAEDLIRG